MNRYELQNAAHKVDGYYEPPRDATHVAKHFLAAQSECIGHFRLELARLESLTVDQFLTARGGFFAKEAK